MYRVLFIGEHPLGRTRGGEGGEEETEEDGRKERWGQERQEGSVMKD